MIRALAVLLVIAAIVLAAMRAWGSEAQLQQWIDEATEAGGGEVTLPTGIVEIEKGLTIRNAEKIRLIGLDAEACILKLIADVPLLTITNSTQIQIEKLTFGGLAEPSTHPLLTFTGKADAPGSTVITRCFFESHTGPGIELTHATNSRIAVNTFMDLTGPAITGGTAIDGLWILDNHFARCPAAAAIPDSAQKVTLRANESLDVKSPTD